MALSFIHDEPFELNGLNATYAPAALDRLAKLLDPPKEKTCGKTP